MMSDSTDAKPDAATTTSSPLDAGEGSARPSTAAAPVDAPASSMAAAPADAASTSEADDATATLLAPAAGSTSTRKRVFTFQKRWLHTLPIMEKVLPDSALDAASVVALRAANLLGDDGRPVDDAGAREVVVCMLCDDPSSNRETLKLWSRLNCRRGRIENHLMSKHPEFMLLLKQKREAEGDLAVQIFLQNMREGRCNVRSEISAGLYSHMHAISSVELTTNAKRAFGHDEFMMPTTTAAAGPPAAALSVANSSAASSTIATSQPKHPQGAFAQDAASDKAFDAEGRRKRLRTNAHGDTLATAPEHDPEASSDALAVSLLSYDGPAAFAQWRNLMSNKMVVVTGGEKASIARVATNLWLIGANVLVTFAEQDSMEAFAASYLTQFHSAGGMEPPRGIMLPLYNSLQSRSEIEEWSRSIATKFGQVDFLLNFVDADTAAANDSPSTSGDKHVSSNANRCRDICEAFSAACMQRSGRNAIINISASETDDGRTSAACTAVEAITNTLSTQLQATNVQVNAIVLQQPDAPATGDEDIELVHLILFLLSPASMCVSGSVLRHRRSPGSAVPTTETPAATPATSTADHPTTAASTLHPPSDAIAASTLSNGVELQGQVI